MLATGAATLRRISSSPFDATTSAALLAALDVIRTAFERFPVSALAISFNGGKDCLIVLHLIFAFLSSRPDLSLPRVVYFCKKDDFAEMTDFMRETAQAFGFKVDELDMGFKQGLELLKSQGVKACFMGQRRTDPFAPSQHFEKTSEGWPEITRINPILDLDYSGVWAFLKTCNLKYCCLYDEGYTSLGSKSHTVPHPKLTSPNSAAQPAHLLTGDDERAGRAQYL